ncbi:MAG: TIGR01458 family HAD-type hydrolase [Gammaproteobacteria bacterium]|nr:TIGR01458 family HAD-type hydrolase [Gammaproteobacteria bacterium]MDH3448463.1 TIGR01458 family HAD-type hydrolase [Gammaproteobacteria bacterium]
MLANGTARYALLIDLDGVIYQGDRLVAGAIEALDWIKRQRVPHLFVTNTTSRPRAALLEKFETLGFSASADEVMTPAIAATQWLANHGMQKAALFVPPATVQDFSRVDTVTLDSDAAVDAVVIGDLGEAWDFRLLNRAFQMLMRDPQPCLVALGMTRYWRGKNGLQLDVAPFVKALEHAASCEAIVVGKPAQGFFDAALEILGVSAERALMIGDDIVGDVGAAQRCGIRGIQVKTGKFRDSDLDGEIEPFAVLDSFADLPAWWERTLST